MDAGLLHLAGPSDVIGLIEAGFQLDQDCDLLFVAGGGDEGVQEGGIPAGPI